METIDDRGGYRNVCGIAVTVYYCSGKADQCEEKDLNWQVVAPGRSPVIAGREPPKAVCPTHAVAKFDGTGQKCEWR